MKNGEGNISYIYHSSFIVETKNFVLVFDYTTNKYIDNITLIDSFIDNNKELFVFVTHGHSDHFDPVILTWSEYNKNIKYIISDDVFIDSNKNNIFHIEKYSSLKFDDIFIETYGTTDRGLSFLVHVDNLNIYHSGDLNWWHWKNDDTETQKKEELDYKKEVNMLKDKNIDIAFVPVDPRLEEFYYLAGEYFAKTLKPKLLIPMHFEDKVDTSNKIQNKLRDLTSVNVWKIDKPLSKYIFNKI